MNEKLELIKDYITEYECDYLYDSDNGLFDCNSCSNLEECYIKAQIKCDVEFAEDMDFCGYNTAEDFWEQLYN